MDPFDSLGTPEYSRFISLSRYARWLPEDNRRETWHETVSRYFAYMDKHLKESHDYTIPKKLRQELFDAVYGLQVMPSMRALMTAGPALDRCHVAGFNCSYLPIDHPRAFDELLYILMCGTGVGFSVEEDQVKKLPEVNEVLEPCDTVIKVADSKGGWAKAYRQLVSLLYAGQIPGWDVSALRPAGARLVTFGGRSSGPEPLEALFRFTVEIFKEAQGRQLTSLECHDLCCKIGEIVVVGGVRRSALISLSDIKDIRMRDAKSGEWWRKEPQRSLSNNSAVYNRTPDMNLFFEEWHALYKSKSGERGIFNRDSVKKHLKTHVERRDPEHPFGCNPCSLHEDTILMTDEGPKRIKDLQGEPFNAVVNGKVRYAPKGSWISGKKDLWRLSTKDGYELILTDDHRLMTKDGWKEVRDLTKGETLLLSTPSEEPLTWEGEGSWDHGYLLGIFVGDGNFSQNTANGSQWGQAKVFKKDSQGFEGIYEEAERAAYASPWKRRSDWNGWGEHSDYFVMNLGRLPFDYGFSYGDKTSIEHLETLTSSEFQRAFLRGLFDTDGHFEGTQEKGYSVRLGQASYSLLQVVQRMLLRFGIKAVIRGLHPERAQMMPDGCGGEKEYQCQAVWRLIVSGKSVKRFFDHIGFSHKGKAAKEELIKGIRWKKETWTTKLDSVEYVGTQDVWDAEVEDVVSFDANGFWAHNSEINLRPYQFCNLTEVVVRPNDTEETLQEKVRLATILGTFQSTLTDYKYLRKIWKKNSEEERLLGVSMTGIMDNPLLLAAPEDFLSSLRGFAVEVNKKYAKALGIEESAAITCVKPSGTVSQLVDSASGIHPRHAPFYIRRVRGDKKDPLTEFMIAMGFPHEEDVFNPHAVVFEFPMRSPEGSLTRDQISAIDHLRLWKAYQEHWCEHKPSATISVKEDDWMKVGAWVFENFDRISGVSFLPHEEHTYQQAPYEEITEEEFKALSAKMPQNIEWSRLQEYEKEDTTVGSQEIACASGFCEIT